MAKYALIIGIAKYDNFLQLPKAAADAEAIASLFERHNYTVSRLPARLVTANQWAIDPDKRLIAAELRNGLKTFLRHRANNQEAVIYFAGHGFRGPDPNSLHDEQIGYLATSNTAQSGQNAIRFDAFSNWLKDANLSSLVILLDCCYAGSLIEQKASLRLIQTTVSHKQNSCLITACRDFEQAREGTEHGIFTDAVLQGLSHQYEGRREVTSNDLVGFVSQELRNSGQEVTCAGKNFNIPLISHPTGRVNILEPDENIIPYRGLEPFEEEQTRFFFGREHVVDNIWKLLDPENFVAVIGASGSGKSSVVRAGLIPLVKAMGDWQILPPLEPGTSPLSKLVALFESFFPEIFHRRNERIQLNNFIRTEPEGLKKLADSLPGSERFLLVVDQFEEIFTLSNGDDRTRFIDLLTQAASHLRIAVVIAMRADFLDLCLKFSTGTLTHLIQKQTVLMPPLESTDLERVITQPAELQGYSLEAGLLGKILQDTGQEQGILPLLQFSLLELWKKRNKRTRQLELVKYNQIGGIAGALERHAEAFYQNLENEEKKWLKRICLQLIRTGNGEKDTRQRQPLRRILEMGNDSEQIVIRRIVENFTDERLFITGAEDGEEWVDLVHEALMERWTTFAGWCKEDRPWRQLKDRMYELCQDWKDNGQDSSFLLHEGKILLVEEQVEGQREKLEELYQLDPDFRRFFQGSYEQYKKIELVRDQTLFYSAKQAQVTLQSETPMVGFVEILELMHENQKSRPLTNLTRELPSVIQDTLRQSMEISREQNRFHNEEGMVKCVAISPDAQLVVSGSEDRKLKLWNVKGECRAVLQGHENTVWAVAFMPDGNRIISGSEDQTLRLWNLEGQQIGEPFTGHEGSIRAVAVSRNGKFIASGSKDKTIRIWNLDGTPYGEPFRGHEGWVLSVAFSPDSDFIVSGSTDGTIRRWDLNGNQQGEPFKGHKRWVRSVSVSDSGEFIVSGGEDRTIRIWNLDGSLKREPFKGHQDRVLSVAVSSQDKFIVSGSADCTIRVWDLEGHSIGEPLHGHDDWVRSVRVSLDRKFIASASRDKSVRLWDLQGNLMSQVLQPDAGRILTVAFSPDGQFIASGGEDKKVRLWDLGNLERQPTGQTFEGHDDWIRSIRFTNNGNIVSGSADSKIRLWDLQGNCTNTLSDGHERWVRSVAVSTDGEFIISSSDDKTVCLWRFQDGEYCLSECFGRHDDRVISVAISPDSKFVVSGSADKTIRLWTLDGGSAHKTFLGHRSRVLSVAFAPDGKNIVSGGQDKTVRLWDLSGNQIWQTQLHEDKVRAVTFSPDGNFIASGSEDRTICLWDLDGNRIGKPLKGHQGTVRSVKFSPDGKRIVSGSEDGTLRLWDVGNWEDWLKVCCDRIVDHQTQEAKKATAFCQLLVRSGT
jgi:WD40 repeat protein